MARGKTPKTRAAQRASIATASGSTGGPDTPAGGAPAKGIARSAATPPKRLGYTVQGLAKAVPCGPTTIYAEMKAGRLRGVKIGRSTIIPDASAEAWMAALPAYTPGGDAFNKRGQVTA